MGQKNLVCRLAQSSRFPLIVSLAANSPELARAAAAGGADAVKVHLNTVHEITGSRFGSWSQEQESIRAVTEVVDGLAVGVVPGQTDPMASNEEFDQMAQVGVDFWDAPWASLPVRALELASQGGPSVMAALAAADAEQLPMLSAVPGVHLVEAAVVEPAQVGGRFRLGHLLRYLQVARAVSRPVFVPAQVNIEPDDLPLLRQIGVAGVILGPLVVGKTPEEVRTRVALYRVARDRMLSFAPMGNP